MTEISEDEPLLGRNHGPGEVDLENRDPKLINEHVAKVDFADVIAEPDGIRSVNLVWIISHKTYKYSKMILYFFLSAVLGILLSLIWGLIFAVLAFGNIWVIVPGVRCSKVTFDCLISPFIKCIKSFFRPGFKGLALALRTLRMILRKEQA